MCSNSFPSQQKLKYGSIFHLLCLHQRINDNLCILIQSVYFELDGISIEMNSFDSFISVLCGLGGLGNAWSLSFPQLRNLNDSPSWESYKSCSVQCEQSLKMWIYHFSDSEEM